MRTTGNQRPERSSAPGVQRLSASWRLVVVVLIGLLIISFALLELWERPVSWLSGPRHIVVSVLHWIRVHWLTAGPLSVAVAVLAIVLQRQREYWQERRQRQRQKAAAQTARAKLLADHCWTDEATGWLLQVRQATNPVELRVHPATPLTQLSSEGPPLDLPTKAPVYVPRDVDAKLDEALAGGGFVLLVGDSTAGKSRAAYEAMGRLFGDRYLLVPNYRESLQALLDDGIELRDTVVWLDDLERYLGPKGLDLPLLRRLVGDATRRVVVLATMRSAEYAAYSQEHKRDRFEVERYLPGAERELLTQATRLDLRRHFSNAEQERARERAWDPRIAEALAHAGQYGLTEYLAAGPSLWAHWQGGLAVNNADKVLAGAAIVAAAADCRRAGLTRPISKLLLRSLYHVYLDRSVAQRLRPDAFQMGLVWATKPVQATSALLTAEHGGYVVFDYLVDVLQADPAAHPIPEKTWVLLLDFVQPADACEISLAARTVKQFHIAEQALRIGLRSQDPAIVNAAELGFIGLGLDRLISRGTPVTNPEDPDVKDMLNWWFRAIERGNADAAFSLAVLVFAPHGYGEQALSFFEKAVAGGSHDAEWVMGLSYQTAGDLDGAESWFRKATAGGHHQAEYALGLLLQQRGDMEKAESWLRKAAAAGEHDAEYALGLLLQQRGDMEEAESWLRKAAIAGHHDARSVLNKSITNNTA